MNPNTQAMEEICRAWSGRFAESMMHLVDHCSGYDHSFSSIRQALLDTAGEWRTNAQRNSEELNRMREENEREKRRVEQERQALAARQQELQNEINHLQNKLNGYKETRRETDDQEDNNIIRVRRRRQPPITSKQQGC